MASSAFLDQVGPYLVQLAAPGLNAWDGLELAAHIDLPVHAVAQHDQGVLDPGGHIDVLHRSLVP
jgi:hypothetical protein